MIEIVDRKQMPSTLGLPEIKIPEATSNIAITPDQKTLYVTADMYVVRIRLR